MKWVKEKERGERGSQNMNISTPLSHTFLLILKYQFFLPLHGSDVKLLACFFLSNGLTLYLLPHQPHKHLQHWISEKCLNQHEVHVQTMSWDYGGGKNTREKTCKQSNLEIIKYYHTLTRHVNIIHDGNLCECNGALWFWAQYRNARWVPISLLPANVHSTLLCCIKVDFNSCIIVLIILIFVS